MLRFKDVNGLALSCIDFVEDTQRQSTTRYMLTIEARWIAINMAAVPELRGVLRDQEQRT
jgi:hypothetical protein